MNSGRRLALISQALNELTSHYQEAFLLNVVCHLSLADVSKEMGISSQIAAIYVARAMMHIQRRIDDSETDLSRDARKPD